MPPKRSRAVDTEDGANGLPSHRAKRSARGTSRAVNGGGEGLTVRKSKASTSQDPAAFSEKRFAELFAKYADEDNKSIISSEGIQRLFEDAGIGLEGVTPFLFAWTCKASEFGVLQLAEWDNLIQLQADSPAKLKAAMTDLENLLYSGIPIPPPEAQSLPSPPERKPPPKPKKTGKEGEQPDPSSVAYSRDAFWRLTRDPKQAFKEFYLFCFNLMKKSESRVMEMELATVTWSVTLQPKYPIMERVLEFIAAHPSYKAVNKDLWAMTLEFCLAMQGRELKDWNDEESWPSLLDEFVAWEKERASGNQEDVPMATQEEKS